MVVTPKLKKFIFDKIDTDLEDVLFHPFGRELWLISEDKNWFFVGDCEGTVWYNQIFFNQFFRLFSMGSKNYSPLLKEWFELKTSIFVRKISRRNTNYDYIVEGVLNRASTNDWNLKERHGFSFPIVKKYSDLKNLLNSEKVRIKNI